MVFPTRIGAKVRAYICYIRRESSLLYREIAVGICQERFSSQSAKKRPGRPPLMTKKVKDRFIPTFRKMIDENPNVRVVDVVKECKITSISYRTHILNIK